MKLYEKHSDGRYHFQSYFTNVVTKRPAGHTAGDGRPGYQMKVNLILKDLLSYKMRHRVSHFGGVSLND